MEGNLRNNKILLLNPPGTKMYFRDYYCSKVSKARYYYHPIDLVYLSGRFSEAFNVKVIDAIVENLSVDECLKQIVNFDPGAVCFMSSAPSYHEDMKFISLVNSELSNTEIVGTGDVFRELKESVFMENQFLNAILLDFSTPDLENYLLNIEGEFHNIIFRDNKNIVNTGEVHNKNIFDVATPRWDLFKLDAYHFPFLRRAPFASILTDFGCPFSCEFCPISSLGHKLRSIESIIEELQLLKTLGVKELYIRDQTFAAKRIRTLNLLQTIIDNDLKFGWTCLSRTDVLDVELIKKMKLAGCHTIMVGIESANDEILKTYKKNTKTDEVLSKVSMIRKVGIRVGGFFMIGFPGETQKSILNTIKLACDLPLDYASFNIATPRFGTVFRKKSIENSNVNPEIFNVESSEGESVWINQEMSAEQIETFRRLAVRKFYLRPQYVLRRFFGVKSTLELKNLILEAFSLLKKNSL